MNADINILRREDLAEQAVVFSTFTAFLAQMTTVLSNSLILKADLGIYQVDC